MTSTGNPQQPNPSPRSEPRPAVRAAWVKPCVSLQGSVRQLVRGISGTLADSFGMPGSRKA